MKVTFLCFLNMATINSNTQTVPQGVTIARGGALSICGIKGLFSRIPWTAWTIVHPLVGQTRVSPNLCRYVRLAKAAFP